MPMVPPTGRFVAESSIRTPADVARVERARTRAMRGGEGLMCYDDAEAATLALLG